MRVLQVEDDESTAKTVELMLRSIGYDCDTTALGEQALDLATRNDYDIILLDIMLPDIDGYEVLRRLNAARVSTPVLIQSGLIGRDEMEKGPGFGVDDYLVKPYTKSELTERLQAILEPTRTNQEHENPALEDEHDRRNDPRPGKPARRKQARIKTLKSGQVIFNNSSRTADCIILNLSDGGAAIQPADLYEFPSEFLLKVRYGPTYLCQVCWRHQNKLGVRFINPG